MSLMGPHAMEVDLKICFKYFSSWWF